MSKLYRRDIEGSVQAWLADLPPFGSGVVVLPSGARWPTQTVEVFAQLSLETDGQARPRAAPAWGRGYVRFDVFATLHDGEAPETFPAGRLSRALDDLSDALEQERGLLFGVRAWQTAEKAAGQLEGAILAADDELTVTGGAAFQSDTPELTVGRERIAWTAKVDDGADATFSGLTRGVGHTSALDHPAGAPVADLLGAVVGSLDMGEAEDSFLGWDVASGRMRALLRVPFRVDYATA